MASWFGIWDILLLTVVPLQSLLIAYCHRPQTKAFILSLPTPFTFAVLTLGGRVNVDNVIGMVIVLFYMHGVRLLHYKAKLNIILAIIISALGYCVIGVCLAGKFSRSDIIFWLTSLAVLIVGIVTLRLTPDRYEAGNRSPLPWYIKLPSLVLVILFLLLMKKTMGGFMAVFPMMGVVTSYEARKCLWSICRQIPVMLICFVPMFGVCWLVQDRWGIAVALILGWATLLTFLLPMMKLTWRPQVTPC